MRAMFLLKLKKNHLVVHTKKISCKKHITERCNVTLMLFFFFNINKVKKHLLISTYSKNKKYTLIYKKLDNKTL